MTEFDVLAGTRGLRLADVAHVLVPGRGRDGTGRGLSAAGMTRVKHAAALYLETRPAGRVVCSGYRTPGDLNGGTWSPPGSAEGFIGIPEADAMRAVLVEEGVPERAIEVERHSMDTVTNLVRVEAGGHFGDDRPVAIVAQEAHLTRILRVVAPRVLQRDFLGVVVPDPTGQDEDGQMPRLVSRMVLFGVNGNTENLVALTERRVTRIWKAARRLGAARYHTD